MLTTEKIGIEIAIYVPTISNKEDFHCPLSHTVTKYTLHTLVSTIYEDTQLSCIKQDLDKTEGNGLLYLLRQFIFRDNDRWIPVSISPATLSDLKKIHNYDTYIKFAFFKERPYKCNNVNNLSSSIVYDDLIPINLQQKGKSKKNKSQSLHTEKLSDLFDEI